MRQNVITIMIDLNLSHRLQSGALEAQIKPADAGEQTDESIGVSTHYSPSHQSSTDLLAAVDLQFAQDAAHVRTDRLNADTQPFGDLRVGQTGSH